MKRFYTFLIATLLSASLFAQGLGERDIFDNGLKLYQTGRFEEAQTTFLRLLQEYPNGQLATATRLMLAKAYYKIGDYTRAEYVCKNFFSKHPDSEYLDDMYHLLGNAMFKAGNYTEAVAQWQWVVNNSRDRRLVEMDSDYSFRTMIHFMDRREVETIRRNYPDGQFGPIATVALAARLDQDGDSNRARSLLRRLTQEQPNHPIVQKAREMLGAEGSGSTGSSGNGAGLIFLKAAQGEDRGIADDLEMGMQYALQEFRSSNPNDPINLRTVEYDPTVIGALTTAKEEIQTLNPLGMIGPVDPDHAASLALLSNYEQRPYVVPLSSQTGLTDLSRFAFQINPDARTKGKFLADYASGELNSKKIAILAPVNAYGESFVKSFTGEVEGKGGSVVSLQWYYEDAQDFTRQFRAIWREGIFLAFKDSLLEARPEVGENEIQAAYQKYLEDKFEPMRRNGRIDSTDVTAKGIDALLVIIRSSEYIQYMAPQLAFNNIETVLLGNEGWNDSDELRKYRTYLEGMIYTTASYYDPNSSRLRLFTNRFRTAMQVSPEAFHILGYDIMKWWLSNYSAGINRQDMRDRLERSDFFQGILQSIQFSSTPRVNSSLTVLKLNRGQIIKLN
ncbi:MAG: ABC transporter substrate-binding protein [Calditrichaeota bacterium]|nr:ABC transporter substrate-binding protein [Calditrichota bacterium]